nr:hypothetical protein [Tanacetum cinerariifolium]
MLNKLALTGANMALHRITRHGIRPLIIRRSTQEGTKALVSWIDEVTVAAWDLHLLRDGLAYDSEEESPADDSDVVSGYMVDNRADLQWR